MYFRYGGDAKVVHFLGKTKPWSYTFDLKTRQVIGSVHEATAHSSFLQEWWILYSEFVVPMLKQEYGDQLFFSGCVEVSEDIYFLVPAVCIYSASNYSNRK